MASNSMLRRCLRLLPSVARVHCNRTLATAIFRPKTNLINPVSKSNHLLSALYLTTVKPSVRFYADSHGPTKEEVENRVMEVLRSFDKVDVSKLTVDAHFINDLGLDSLDTVEIVMAFEDEFALEISDADAEKIFNCKDAIAYVVDAMGIE